MRFRFIPESDHPNISVIGFDAFFTQYKAVRICVQIENPDHSNFHIVNIEFGFKKMQRRVLICVCNITFVFYIFFEKDFYK